MHVCPSLSLSLSLSPARSLSLFARGRGGHTDEVVVVVVWVGHSSNCLVLSPLPPASRRRSPLNRLNCRLVLLPSSLPPSSVSPSAAPPPDSPSVRPSVPRLSSAP